MTHLEGRLVSREGLAGRPRAKTTKQALFEKSAAKTFDSSWCVAGCAGDAQEQSNSRF
jgi:hypothetical protein